MRMGHSLDQPESQRSIDAAFAPAEAEPGYPSVFEAPQLAYIFQYVTSVMGGIPKPGSMLAEILLARR
jgi:hypothetical protein